MLLSASVVIIFIITFFVHFYKNISFSMNTVVDRKK